MRFKNRSDAAQNLAESLKHFEGTSAVIVGIPRGGVPIAHEVSRTLSLPFDIVLVRKLGVPSQSELAFGAIGEGGVKVLNDDIVIARGLTPKDLSEVEAQERSEIDRRVAMYRRGVKRKSLKGRTVIVVDDGIATGATARAACMIVRRQGAKRVVLATPVAPAGWIDDFSDVADEMVSVITPTDMGSVGQYYEDFSAVSDKAVISLLASDIASAGHIDVHIPFNGGQTLPGVLAVPTDAKGLVVFVHGSGSSRNSPRNIKVAKKLQEHGLATLLFDLLTSKEEQDRSNVFDIELLADRIRWVLEWISHTDSVSALPLGLFGASTGAAAALVAATRAPHLVHAVVSRGGRPDLATAHLAHVSCPVLMIVGKRDTEVLQWNREAGALLQCPNQIEIIPGASHLFEEAGTLDQAAEQASEFFLRYLGKVPQQT
jgi:putative phosphoribosyl transferase